MGRTEDLASIVEDDEALLALYPPRRYLQILDRLDVTCQQFIRRSPLLIIGSAHPVTGLDLSPRGGTPGFVHILGEHRLAIPDRAGNNRLDTMRNILVSSNIGLFFLIPGIPETLRIKGEARLSTDPRLISEFARRDQGNLAIVVTVQCAFIHCAKALNHGRLWNADHRVDPSDLSRAHIEPLGAS